MSTKISCFTWELLCYVHSSGELNLLCSHGYNACCLPNVAIPSPLPAYTVFKSVDKHRSMQIPRNNSTALHPNIIYRKQAFLWISAWSRYKVLVSLATLSSTGSLFNEDEEHIGHICPMVTCTPSKIKCWKIQEATIWEGTRINTQHITVCHTVLPLPSNHWTSKSGPLRSWGWFHSSIPKRQTSKNMSTKWNFTVSMSSKDSIWAASTWQFAVNCTRVTMVINRNVTKYMHAGLEPFCSPPPQCAKTFEISHSLEC